VALPSYTVAARTPVLSPPVLHPVKVNDEQQRVPCTRAIPPVDSRGTGCVRRRFASAQSEEPE
jgi:hypothetical protein